MQEAKLLTVHEAAEATGASVSFWRKRVADRSLPVVRVGRLVRLRPSDVDAYLARRTTPARTAGNGEASEEEDPEQRSKGRVGSESQ